MPERPNAQSGKPQVTPEMYAQVFETFHVGAQVLEDLLLKFGGNPYRKGGLEGDRATCFHAGQNDVVNWITNQINRAAQPATTEDPDQ